MTSKVTSVCAMLLLSLAVYAQIPSYVPANGLLAYYDFTGDANDLTGNGHHGTENGATSVVDRFGNANGAYQFDGGAFIDIPYHAAFDGQQISFGCWVYLPNASSGTGYYIMGIRNSSYNFALLAEYQGKLQTQISWAPGQAEGGAALFNCIGSWHLAVVTYDQSIASDNATFYIDGDSIEAFTFDTSYFLGSSSFRFGIELNNNHWEDLVGTVDDAFIYSRILSQSEIQQIHNGPTAIETPLTEMFSIYPNPTAGKFTINTPNEPCEFWVVNALGETIMNRKTSRESNIEVSLNNGGSYFVRLVTQEGMVTKKIFALIP